MPTLRNPVATKTNQTRRWRESPAPPIPRREDDGSGGALWGMSQAASGAGAAAGAAGTADIISALIGAAGGVYGILEAKKQAKKAKRAEEEKYRRMIELLRTQGESSKAAIRQGGVEERGQISQSAVDRGLFNSSVLDSLLNVSRDRESRALTSVDESVANRLVDVEGSVVNAYPSTSGILNNVGASANVGGQLLDRLFAPPPAKAKSQTPVEQVLDTSRVGAHGIPKGANLTSPTVKPPAVTFDPAAWLDKLLPRKKKAPGLVVG